jgi:hypothetical protein
VLIVTTGIKIRASVLAVHGCLAMLLGFAFFYLRANMSNGIFEVASIVAVIFLAAGVLIAAAIADWFAALSEGLHHSRRFFIYLLAGAMLAAAGFVLAYDTEIALGWLVICAAIHALLLGFLALGVSFRKSRPVIERRAMSFIGIVSIFFCVVLASAAREMVNSSETGLLGAYLWFLGVKTLFFAWGLRRNAHLAKISGITLAVPVRATSVSPGSSLK